MPAKLNIDADMLANNYKHNKKTNYKKVHQLPISKAQLEYNEETITSKYSIWLRDLINTPKLMSYLKERNEWNDETFSDINWEAYYQSSSHC